MIRRTALRPQGARAARWASWQASQRRLVLRRSRYTCEACGKGEFGIQPDWHHVVGRGAHVAEPWTSSAALTAAICRPCHGDLHDGRMAPEVRSGLLWAAVGRLSEAMGRMPAPQFGLPLDTIWDLLRIAKAQGITPPGWEPDDA